MTENEYSNSPQKKKAPSKVSVRTQKRRRKKLKIALSFAAIVVILLIVLVALLSRSCGSNADGTNAADSKMIGTYIYDEQTQYEFREDGIGAMKLGSSTYNYTYRIEEDTLFLDFESDSLSDCQYTFVLEKDVLTLKGGEGTVGGTYTLTKQE